MNEVRKSFSLCVDSPSLLYFFCDVFGLFSSNSFLKYRRLMRDMIKQFPTEKGIHDASTIKETAISILNSRLPSSLCCCLLFLKQYLQTLTSNDYPFANTFSSLVPCIIQCLSTVPPYSPHACEICGDGLSCLRLLCQKNAGLKQVALNNQTVHLVCMTMAGFADALQTDRLEEEARERLERGIGDAIILVAKLLYDNRRGDDRC